MKGRGPQVKGSAWAKAYWLWGSCLLQTMLFVTPTSVQSLTGICLASPSLPSSFPLSLGILFQAGPRRVAQSAVGTLLSGL